MKHNPFPAHAVILAGGRGTRFWPRSRTRTPKQLLNIVSERTMLQQTVDRLAPVFPPSRLWVVTNDAQAAAVRRQLPRLPAAHVLSEPAGRNTAAAIGLAAVHLARLHDDALMGVLPADHFIARAERYRRIVRAALEVAARGPNLVVLGIVPTHPETGFGYIERMGGASRVRGARVYRVRRFTEKPPLARARQYVASGRYFWNAGMFFWRVSTFLEHLQKFLPTTRAALMRVADAVGTSRYATTLRRTYPTLKNISVDYAVMEPATRVPGADNVFVLPADVGWSDIGSWAAVYELLADAPGANLSTGRSVFVDAAGNFFWCPGKFVAGIGIRDLIVVETPDALLICPRDRAQDVARIVKWLEENRVKQLL
jgi:mannose-1-phosphate guanylyltransferase